MFGNLTHWGPLRVVRIRDGGANCFRLEGVEGPSHGLEMALMDFQR